MVHFLITFSTLLSAHWCLELRAVQTVELGFVAALAGDFFPVVDHFSWVLHPQVEDCQFLKIAEVASGSSECGDTGYWVGLPYFSCGCYA